MTELAPPSARVGHSEVQDDSHQGDNASTSAAPPSPLLHPCTPAQCAPFCTFCTMPAHQLHCSPPAPLHRQQCSSLYCTPRGAPAPLHMHHPLHPLHILHNASTPAASPPLLLPHLTKSEITGQLMHSLALEACSKIPEYSSRRLGRACPFVPPATKLPDAEKAALDSFCLHSRRR